MLNLRASIKVAVTGGIASGKSTVCSIFKEYGAYVLSADEIVHKLLVPTTEFGQRVINLLGSDIVVRGQISRERIAKKIFSDSPELLQALEKLIHPEVQRVIEAEYKTVSQSKQFPLFVVEMPLLYEAGFESDYDVVIVVTSSEKTCKERFMFGDDQYKQRKKRLIPIDEKMNQADYVIKNDGSLLDLREKIQTIITSLKENL